MKTVVENTAVSTGMGWMRGITLNQLNSNAVQYLNGLTVEETFNKIL